MVEQRYIPCFTTRAMRFDLKLLVDGAEMDSLVRCLAVLKEYALPKTLAGCVEQLDRYVLSATQDDADTYLGFFQAVGNIYTLYEHYFPEEFARSTKSIVPELDEAYSDREREFFSLVENHLFSLPWFLDDTTHRDERMYSLPLVPLGREWWNDGLEGWELGWLLLLWLIGEGAGEVEIRKRFPEVAEALFPLPVKRGTLAFRALEQGCRRVKTPLASLPEALNILYHDTGSWFLDIYSETSDATIDLNQQGMDRAIVHMRRATKIMRRADCFITWVDEDPIPRFKEVLTLWNLSYQEKQDNRIMLLNLTHPTER